MAAVEKPISFLQDDSEWGSKPYTITGSSYQTIATSGCGPTSAAMVVHYYADDSVTPVDLADFAINNGHRTYSNGTAWSFFGDVADEYDLDFLQTASSSEALEWMKTQEDPLVVCAMGRGLWTNGGHFILLWDVQDGVAHINDPFSTADYRTTNYYSTVASQCYQFFCFDRPEEKKVYQPIKPAFLFNSNNLSFFIIQQKNNKPLPFLFS